MVRGKLNQIGKGASLLSCDNESIDSRPVSFTQYFGFTYTLTLLSIQILLALVLAPVAAAANELVEARESRYNNIYVYRRGTYMTMKFGHNRRFFTESVVNLNDELELPVHYTRLMTVGMAYARELGSLLEVGFGGGRTAWYLHKNFPELSITSVELDPEVYKLAEKYFGVRAEKNFNIMVSDGRKFLRKNKTKRDIILVDAYRGPFVPFHLLTREFFQVLRSRLAQDGVLVQNVEPTTMVFEAALSTVGSVFKNVDVYDAGGNVVIVAYDGKAKRQSSIENNARAISKERQLRYSLFDMVKTRRIFKGFSNPKILTDDFAPVDSLLAIERHNRKLDSISIAPRN